MSTSFPLPCMPFLPSQTRIQSLDFCKKLLSVSFIYNPIRYLHYSQALIKLSLRDRVTMTDGEELRSILSVNIKQLRDKLGFSQAVLAEKTGISITFLSAIEREKKWPYPETLSNLAGALGVGVHELFKKEQTVSNEVVTAISKCLDDVSLGIRQNINKAILQSVENIREYYTGKIGE